MAFAVAVSATPGPNNAMAATSGGQASAFGVGCRTCWASRSAFWSCWSRSRSVPASRCRRGLAARVAAVDRRRVRRVPALARLARLARRHPAARGVGDGRHESIPAANLHAGGAAPVGQPKGVGDRRGRGRHLHDGGKRCAGASGAARGRVPAHHAAHDRVMNGGGGPCRPHPAQPTRTVGVEPRHGGAARCFSSASAKRGRGARMARSLRRSTNKTKGNLAVTEWGPAGPLIPMPIDQNPLAQARWPMEMIFQGCSARLFQA